RLSMLLAKYVDDVVMSQNTRAIKSRKDSLWSLVEKLTFVFNHPNPTEHYLFENVPEINEEGIKNILSFYETGKLRFQEVLEEDVYKTKPQTSK
ncbi:14842_t:CDS:1, partial [Racocetra fulgida]